ncbi:hypothetical protein FA13DRAFT_1414636 [Coprinellus micaceus]|uniref:Uncharacterized protein n=1 Tax=Coprinellus micaceus TaxID=71717 RepID=A0A4Y7SQE3_COPMI|nr:hypothetical protein FA13DRAFT_1414636 [Coprinellus micaceus]
MNSVVRHSVPRSPFIYLPKSSYISPFPLPPIVLRFIHPFVWPLPAPSPILDFVHPPSPPVNHPSPSFIHPPLCGPILPFINPSSPSSIHPPLVRSSILPFVNPPFERLPFCHLPSTSSMFPSISLPRPPFAHPSILSLVRAGLGGYGRRCMERLMFGFGHRVDGRWDGRCQVKVKCVGRYVADTT